MTYRSMECPVTGCGRLFDDVDSLNSHMAVVHPGVDVPMTDGGVVSYQCDECGEIPQCNVDDVGQRRCPECNSAVTATVTDGGVRLSRSLDSYVRSEDTLAGVGDQELPCLDDDPDCPGPNAHQPGDLPCATCFIEGGAEDGS